ncbi:MAG: hypothetical protein QOE90_1730 [Thermoplasmata archaeon]|nr:hypothetical protein [Thermoplasmata archaeon]
MAPSAPEETSRAILYLLYEGHTHEEILALHPTLTRDDIARAAGEGLAALETQGAARVESRAERIARVRVTCPNAFFPWAKEDDVLLLRLRDAGRTLRQIAAELGRQPGAIRLRLEKWSRDPEGARQLLSGRRRS